MKPITPAEVAAKKGDVLPPEVIDEWNKIIAAKWTGSRADVGQNAIVSALVERMKVSREAVFENDWLEIEALFESVGWKVAYDKPAYCETYEATFTFTAKRRR